MKLFFSLTFSFLAFAGLAQLQKIKAADPVKWTFSWQASKDAPDEIVLEMKAVIEKGWHTYSQQASAEGPVPTTFSFEKDSLKYQLTGKTGEPAGEKKMDEAFGAEVISFEENVVFLQKIKRLSKSPFRISGTVEFMCCNNMQCLPPKTIDFSFDIK